MARESWEYGDPEMVAIRRQEEEFRREWECGRCIHKVSLEVNGKLHVRCEFKRRTYGKRCELHKIKRI